MIDSRSIPTFSDLEIKEIVGAFAAYGVERKLAKGQLLYMTGDDANKLWYLHAGRIFSCYMKEDGTLFPTGTIQAPFFIGEDAFLGSSGRISDVMAATDCVLYAMNISTLFSLMEKRPLLMRQVTTLIAAKIMYTNNLLGALTQTSAKKKVAYYLAQASCIMGNQIKDLTKENIANYVGITRSTASRILNQFQRDGLICLSYSSISVQDFQGLIDVCNEDEKE